MQKQTYIAKTLFGLENILAKELFILGAQKITPGNRMVSFEGDKELLYKANLQLRTAIRIIIPFHSFGVRDEYKLYREIKNINWEQYLKMDTTFAIDSTVYSDYFPHTKYVALKMKDAIVDQFREKYGERPSIDVENPDVRFNIHIDHDWCTLSLDSSGNSLHMRGYRQEVNEAPLNEVLAAGLIQTAGYTGECAFVDGFCGSGTLLIEAAMIACNIPAQKFRKEFGFMTWQDYDKELWNKVLENAVKQEKNCEFPIVGSDLDAEAVRISKLNIDYVGLSKSIQVSLNSFQEITPPEGPGILLVNPPYGERMSEDEEVKVLYKEVGDTLKKKFAGYEAWVLSSNKEAMKLIGLRTSKKMTFMNSSLECKFHCYSLYAGSRKAPKEGTEEVK